VLSLGSRVNPFLEEAGQCGGSRHKPGEFVDGKHGTPRGIMPKTIQKFFPARVFDGVHARHKSRHLARQGTPLQSFLALVGNIIDVLPSSERLADQARFATPAATIEAEQGRASCVQVAPQSSYLFSPVQKWKSHEGYYARETLCFHGIIPSAATAARTSPRDGRDH
jgi:hypothetical protein